MARREPKTTKALEVSVMFEPSHVAPACVAQAYERVVPITRRAAPTASTTAVLVVSGSRNV